MKTESNVVDLQDARLEEDIKKAAARYRELEHDILEQALVLGGLLLKLRLKTEGYEKFLQHVAIISELKEREIYNILKLAKHESVVRIAMKDSGVNSIRGALLVVKELPDPEDYQPPQQKRGRKKGTKNKKTERTGWVKEANKVGLLTVSSGGSQKKKVREQVELILGHPVPGHTIAAESPEAEELHDALISYKWAIDPEAASEDADRLEAILSSTAKNKLEKAIQARFAVLKSEFMLDGRKSLNAAIETAIGLEKTKLAELKADIDKREQQVIRREAGVQKLLSGKMVGFSDLKADFRLLKQVAHPDKFQGKPETAEKAMEIIKKLERALLL